MNLPKGQLFVFVSNTAMFQQTLSFGGHRVDWPITFFPQASVQRGDQNLCGEDGEGGWEVGAGGWGGGLGGDMVRRWHCIHDELKAVVVTCIRLSQLKFQQDEGLVRPHPKLRNYRQLVGAGGGELFF